MSEFPKLTARTEATSGGGVALPTRCPDRPFQAKSIAACTCFHCVH
jgi:hypothetical protein